VTLETQLILAALFLTMGSGLPGLFFKGGRSTSQRIATILHLLGCATGVTSVLLTLTNYLWDAFPSPALQFPWPLPGGVTAIHLDALSAFFLFPVFVVMGAGSIYGQGYWSENENPNNGRKLRFFYGALTAGLALVMIAGDAWSFLIGWEFVGLSAFFLVTTESDNREALRAGWIYLIAAHVSTLVLFAMFAALHASTGTWQLNDAIPKDSVMIGPILMLALIGFGIKAGLMPFHVWLPEAHATAPSHVSAVLSGVVLKLGIYGLVRIMTLLPFQHWFGLTLLFAGIGSGVLGVVFALAQHDLKRLLAYHSIENIGIIFIGLGAGVLGQNETWGALAMAGALLHVWNHAFFKSLLFFAAGSVVHATGTRMIDELGGLWRNLQTTGISFLVGAVAICGLPPLNGFVSEWLIYLASFRKVIGEGASGDSAIFAAPALALIGGLAVACFVKAFSVVFLGNPRSVRFQNIHREPPSMRIAMGLLVAACIIVGIWPLAVYGALSQVTAAVLGHNHGSTQIYSVFSQLPVANVILLATTALIAIAIAGKVAQAKKAVTWDCGYAAPNARMQYTASSFAAPFVDLFRWVVRPQIHRKMEGRGPCLPESKRNLFPDQESFESDVPDPVLERFLVPGISRGQRLLAYLRFVQTGRTQVYILYIIAALLALIAWSAL
jgi:hydrogenase-4 component B